MVTQKKSLRNQSMDVWKFFASFFVVFLHVNFPGALGEIVTCIGRVAVPVFFAISGYFNYRADSGKIAKRMKHILDLNIWAIAVYVLWGCINTELKGGSTVAYLITSIPDKDEMVRWFVLQVNPFAGHLWYLTAIGVCYILFWMYVKFFGTERVTYQPLYVVGFCLQAIRFVLIELSVVAGMEVHYLLGRNAWFTGMPMFIFGLFVREYQDRILKNYGLTTAKLLLLFLTGIVLSILQYAWLGTGAISIGTMLAAVATMLFLCAHPTIPAKCGILKSLIAKCGFYSTVIYIVHLLLIGIYETFLYPASAAGFGAAEVYLRPVIILVMSVAAAILWERVICLVRRIRK